MVLNMNTYVVPASLERERERHNVGPDFVLGKHLAGMWAKFCDKLIFLTP